MADNSSNQEQPQNPRQNPQQPGLVGSHYQYVKGAAEVRSINSSFPHSHHLTSPGHRWRLDRFPRMESQRRARQGSWTRLAQESWRTERSEPGVWKDRGDGWKGHRVSGDAAGGCSLKPKEGLRSRRNALCYSDSMIRIIEKR